MTLVTLPMQIFDMTPTQTGYKILVSIGDKRYKFALIKHDDGGYEFEGDQWMAFHYCTAPLFNKLDPIFIAIEKGDLPTFPADGGKWTGQIKFLKSYEIS